MEKDRFEIVVRDIKTKEEKVAINLGDDWVDIEGNEFTAKLDDVVERIQQADDTGGLFDI